ncbi:MAG: glucosamine--fructose-6-phosphate aminotransferase [Geobacteraceae bacterium]|nr:MAG: glucosamine--fructose-6-phosphate aminotransferase [Geobacteraceae bacterium]
MCGIVGYIGNREATPIILDGLTKLEYRGYDSAGVCTITGGEAEIRRSEGKLANLVRLVDEMPLLGNVGIGHTRWATHGRPSETNAHPHQAGSVVIVHNGIIENYPELKGELKRLGHTFKSETDTEIISHLIEHKMKIGIGFEQSVRQTLRELKGSYALCILCEDEPETLIAAKYGSPLVVGLGEREFFVASDIPAILSHTRSMVFMEDGEVAIFREGEVAFSTVKGQPVIKNPRHIDWSPLMAEKGGYRHFMIKEIHEQPRAVQDTIAGRLAEEDATVYLEDLRLSDEELASFGRICIVACGTSWHAALVGKFYLEEHCRIPVEVDIASEFRYRNPVVSETTLVMAISQSGETADTLAAVREAKKRGAKTVAVCNVVESSIARETDGVIYTHAGPEIGVASTKAFVTQLVALYLFAIKFGRTTGAIGREKGEAMIGALVRLPALMEETLHLDSQVESIARRYMHARDFLYLGRGINYPIALEGSLKLKEISYIHAEGYPAGEMKHGPIALIDENMPVVVLAPKNEHYEKVVSNMEEVIARGGRVIALCSAGESGIVEKAEVVLKIPMDGDDLTPILYTVPLQLLAYHVSVLKGSDVDQPRNLAKSVTVE